MWELCTTAWLMLSARTMSAGGRAEASTAAAVPAAAAAWAAVPAAKKLGVEQLWEGEKRWWGLWW